MKYKHFKKLLKKNNVSIDKIWWIFIYTKLGLKNCIYTDEKIINSVKNFECRFDYIGNELEKDNPIIVAKFIDKTQGTVHYLLDNENRYKP